MKPCLSRLFLAAALVALAAPALAQTGNLAVQATVANGCKVQNVGLGIDVAYDAFAASNGGQADVQVRCTKNINFQVAANAGLHAAAATGGLARAVVSGADAIGYKLSIVSGGAELVPNANTGTWASQGRNTDVPVRFYAAFDTGSGVDPAAGVYQDTVVLTFTPIP
jgi:spore coat protein U-like protein